MFVLSRTVSDDAYMISTQIMQAGMWTLAIQGPEGECFQLRNAQFIYAGGCHRWVPQNLFLQGPRNSCSSLRSVSRTPEGDTGPDVARCAAIR